MSIKGQIVNQIVALEQEAYNIDLLIQTKDEEINLLQMQMNILINERNPHIEERKIITRRLDDYKEALHVVEELEKQPIGQEEVE